MTFDVDRTARDVRVCLDFAYIAAGNREEPGLTPCSDSMVVVLSATRAAVPDV